MTISSGAPLGALVNFDMHNKVIVLYKCCEGMVDFMLDEKTMNYINELKKRYPKQLLIPENMNELMEIMTAL